MEKTQDITDTFRPKVVYDAAHAFGNRINGTIIINNGDLSVLSFYATKLYNIMEEGYCL